MMKTKNKKHIKVSKKRNLKFEDCKNCLKTTELENKITQQEKNKGFNM